MSPSEPFLDPDEKPRLVVNGGWPRDLLSWVMALPPLLYLGAVAAGFAGFSAFVIVLLMSQHIPLSIGVGAVLTLVVWVWWAREHFGVTRERIRFFSNCLVADLRPNTSRKGGAFERHVIPYHQIGTLALTSRKACIRFHFDLPHPERRSAFTITLPKLVVRDRLDEFVEWIETSAPDHLFATEAEEDAQWSRKWSLDEVFPDAGSTLGRATIDRFESPARLQCGDLEFELQLDGFGVVRALAAPDEGRATLAATCVNSSTTPVTRIFAGCGLLIASCRMVARDGALQIQTGFGTTILYRMHSGEVVVDEAGIGTVRRHGQGAQLQVSTAIPTPIVWMVILVLSFMPHLVPTPRGSALPAE